MTGSVPVIEFYPIRGRSPFRVEKFLVGATSLIWRNSSAAAHGGRSFALSRLEKKDVIKGNSRSQFSHLHGDLDHDIGPAAAAATPALSKAFELYDTVLHNTVLHNTEILCCAANAAKCRSAVISAGGCDHETLPGPSTPPVQAAPGSGDVPLFQYFAKKVARRLSSADSICNCTFQPLSTIREGRFS